RADVAAWTATASDAAERGVPVIGLCLCAGTPDLAPFASLDALVVTAPTASAVPGALARLLAGRQDFSGRLPVSWPLAGEAASPYLVRDQSRRPPLFPFGAGLSATIRPVLSDLHVRAEGGRLHVVFTVANLSDEAGIAVPEVYLDRATGVAGPPKRLVGWRRVPLLPRQSQQIGLDVPRLAIEHWDAETGGWRGEVGTTWVSLGSSAVDLPLHVAVEPFAPAALSGEVR
ncbi:fibronectin type III-like domain-contianing protein, partial [Ameyamaea chiangmaiensis]